MPVTVRFRVRHCAAALMFMALSIPALAQTRRRTSLPPVPFPGCTSVTGTPAVTFTRDEGRTLANVTEKLTGIGYTNGVAPLDVPGTLLSWHKSTLSLSTDYGCSWRSLGDWTIDIVPTITPARVGRAFAWSDNREFLLRYDARGATQLKSPAAFAGLGTDRANGDHVRAGATNGALLESNDAGESWNQISRLPSEAQALVYRFAFDPQNLDHVIVGTASSGAFVTFDGGKNWSRSSLADKFNVMNFAVSPVDGNVIWAMAVDTHDLQTSVHAIYRSSDGGRTFTRIVTEGAGITIINGPVMAAHPTDPKILYFIFGTSFQSYGTDVFRVDASGDLRVNHNDYDDVDAIAFSPQDPAVMYLGLETEKGVH